jgi:phytoene synthase
MGVGHYENFPVASILLPKRYRPAVTALYRFARSADDAADEGDLADSQRLAILLNYEIGLEAIEQNREHKLPKDLGQIFVPLGETVRQHELPMPYLKDLLDAFRQDVGTKRYATYTDVLHYCKRSANPVGRLILHLHKCHPPECETWSDAICTALQLINFWQDVAIDWQKNRIYLPVADMRAFGVTEEHIEEGRCDANWRRLMNFQIKRTRALMLTGMPLIHVLPGRVGFELRLVILGGLRILEKLERDPDIFRNRPTINKSDWFKLLWRAARLKKNDWFDPDFHCPKLDFSDSGKMDLL